MHRALFGILTVAALIAVGVVVRNRSLENSSAAAKDKAPMSAVVNKDCCCPSTSDAMATSKKSCCDAEVAVSTDCLRKGFVATDSKADATVKTSAKKGTCSCCSEDKEEGDATEAVAKEECKADGSCCASGEGQCCKEKAEAEVAKKSEKPAESGSGNQ